MPGAPTSPSRTLAASLLLTLLAAVALLCPPPAAAQSLRGSPASLDIQNRMARANDFSYLRTAAQVRHFVAKGYLVRVRPNADFELHAVSFPYARPEVELFVRRLAAQYHDACGEKLVVTSLTRPISRQPANASDRSVHPTGMAVDLRRSSSRACRLWLEKVLLELEGAHLVEATQEHYPPHFHVAVFPQAYYAYVERKTDDDVRLASSTPSAASSASSLAAVKTAYKVREGDSLWTIAHHYGTTVDRLQATNDLASSRIYPGQVLDVPAGK